MIPLFASFLFCLFIGLEQGIIIGSAVSLAMLLYSTARPRVLIQQQSVSLIASWSCQVHRNHHRHFN